MVDVKITLTRSFGNMNNAQKSVQSIKAKLEPKWSVDIDYYDRG